MIENEFRPNMPHDGDRRNGSRCQSGPRFEPACDEGPWPQETAGNDQVRRMVRSPAVSDERERLRHAVPRALRTACFRAASARDFPAITGRSGGLRRPLHDLFAVREANPLKHQISRGSQHESERKGRHDQPVPQAKFRCGIQYPATDEKVECEEVDPASQENPIVFEQERHLGE